MEKGHFEQTLETILALREERRTLSAAQKQFHSPEFYYLTSHRIKDIPCDIISAARAHVAALPLLDYETFKRDHPNHPYSEYPKRGAQGFGNGTPDRSAGFCLGLLSYLKTHLETALIAQQPGEQEGEQYRELPMVHLSTETFASLTSVSHRFKKEEAQPYDSLLASVIHEVWQVYQGVIHFLDKELATAFPQLLENSAMFTSSLLTYPRTREEEEPFYSQAAESSASFSYIVPHLTLEEAASMELPFAYTLNTGVLKLEGVDLHNPEERKKLAHATEEILALQQKLQAAHFSADAEALETDLHTYRHAFYDARNIGEYTRVLKEKLPSPARKWYAGPAVLEVEDALEAAHHLAAEKQKQCEEEAQRQQKYLRERYGILRVEINFTSPCDDYFESSKVHFKDCVIEDASHKQLVAKTVAYYYKSSSKSD